MLRRAIFFLLLSLVAADSVHPSKYIALYIRPRCHTALHEVIPTLGAPTATTPLSRVPRTFDLLDLPSRHYITHDEQHDSKYLVVFQHNGRQESHLFSDPRLLSTGGYLTKLEETSYVFYIPSNVTRFTLYCHNNSVAQEFRTDRIKRRRFSTLEEGLESRTLQSVGLPEKQFNLVFLAAGYQLKDKEMFFKNAQTVFSDLNRPETFGASLGNPPKPNFIKQAVPFARYAPFFNVFAVFQPSPDSGASVTGGKQVNNNLQCAYPVDPTGTGLRCDMALSVALAQASPGRARDNRERTGVVALVNHNRYGGTGLFLQDTRFAVFSNYLLTEQPGTPASNGAPTTRPLTPQDHAKMTSLVAHELGHAVTNLMDEYDIGRAENRDIQKPNCALTSASNAVPWKHWLAAENANAVSVAVMAGGVNSSVPEYTVDRVPSQVCGYSNYFKPSKKCMMNTLDAYFMCPVCREAATLKLMEAGPDFTWPQCPLKDQLVMIPTSQTADVYLLLNTALTTDSDFVVTWKDPAPAPEGTLPTLQPCQAGSSYVPQTCRRLIAPFTASTTVFTYQVTVSHRSKWIVKTTDFSTAPWTRTTSFSFMFYESILPPPVANYNFTVQSDTCDKKSLLPDPPGVGYKFRCSIVENATCVLKLTAPEYVRPDVSVQLDEAAKLMFYVVIGIAVLCVVLWIWALCYYKKESGHIARPIFTTEYSTPMKIISIVMTCTAVGLMLLAMTLLAVGLWAYGSMGPFGQILLGTGLVLAFALYVLAFIGYWAVQNRSKRILVANGILLLIALGLSGTLCVIIIHMHAGIENSPPPPPEIGSTVVAMVTGNTVSGSYWYQRLEELWESLVTDSPVYACQMQLYLRCTGFSTTCDSVRADPDDCPECRDAIGKPWSPCQTIVIEFINENYTTLFYSSLTVACSTLFAVMFNCGLYYEVHKIKVKISRQHNQRLMKHPSHRKMTSDIKALVLLQSLTHADKDNLLIEFKKIDRDKSGTLSKVEMHHFLHSALCYNASRAEIERIFTVGDINGDGHLSFAEFIGLFGDSGGTDVPLMANDNHRVSMRRLQEELKRNGVDPEEMHPKRTEVSSQGHAGLVVTMPSHGTNGHAASPSQPKGLSPSHRAAHKAAHHPSPEAWEAALVAQGQHRPSL